MIVVRSVLSSARVRFSLHKQTKEVGLVTKQRMGEPVHVMLFELWTQLHSY